MSLFPCGRLFNLLFDLRSLADSVTQEVQLRSAHTAFADHRNALHIRGMDGEHSLHTDAIGDAADGERLRDTAALASNHGALKNLDSFTLALADVHVNSNGVANVELRNLRLYGILGNQLQCIHFFSS